MIMLARYCASITTILPKKLRKFVMSNDSHHKKLMMTYSFFRVYLEEKLLSARVRKQHLHQNKIQLLAMLHYMVLHLVSNIKISKCR